MKLTTSITIGQTCDKSKVKGDFLGRNRIWGLFRGKAIEKLKAFIEFCQPEQHHS